MKLLWRRRAQATWTTSVTGVAVKQPRKPTRQEKIAASSAPPPENRRQRRKAKRKANAAQDKAVRAKFGTTSILGYGASDTTRIEKRRVTKRIAEEQNRFPVTVTQGCTCPRLCDVHPM